MPSWRFVGSHINEKVAGNASSFFEEVAFTGSVLSSGGFASFCRTNIVFRGVKKNHFKVGMKCFNNTTVSIEERRKQARIEYDNLLRLNGLQDPSFPFCGRTPFVLALGEVEETGSLSGACPAVLMEEAEGRTLDYCVKNNDFSSENGIRLPSAKDVAEIGLALAQTYCEVHSCEVKHRDVQPKNIIVSRDSSQRGDVKHGPGGWHITLIDFANGVNADTGLTNDRFATLYFGAPEVMSGSPEDKELRRMYSQDVWSIGAILYNIRTGQHPYNGIANRRLKLCEQAQIECTLSSALAFAKERHLSLADGFADYSSYGSKAISNKLSNNDIALATLIAECTKFEPGKRPLMNVVAKRLKGIVEAEEFDLSVEGFNNAVKELARSRKTSSNDNDGNSAEVKRHFTDETPSLPSRKESAKQDLLEQTIRRVEPEKNHESVQPAIRKHRRSTNSAEALPIPSEKDGRKGQSLRKRGRILVAMIVVFVVLGNIQSKINFEYWYVIDPIRFALFLISLMLCLSCLYSRCALYFSSRREGKKRTIGLFRIAMLLCYLSIGAAHVPNWVNDYADGTYFYNVGSYYSYGLHGVSQDDEKAGEFMRISAELGNPYAMLSYANSLSRLDKEQYADRISALRSDAFEIMIGRVDNPREEDALYLGHCYYSGLGTDKDDEKAYQYYKAAFDEGYAEDITGKQLGDLCWFNHVEGKSKIDAFPFYKASFDAKEAEGRPCDDVAARLAYCYKNGVGVQHDEAAAQDLMDRFSLTEDDLVHWR